MAPRWQDGWLGWCWHQGLLSPPLHAVTDSGLCPPLPASDISWLCDLGQATSDSGPRFLHLHRDLIAKREADGSGSLLSVLVRGPFSWGCPHLPPPVVQLHPNPRAGHWGPDISVQPDGPRLGLRGPRSTVAGTGQAALSAWGEAPSLWPRGHSSFILGEGAWQGGEDRAWG